MNSTTDALELARALIRCPSVTPADEGAQAVLVRALEPAGFTCTSLPFSQPGTADVDNLFARIGSRRPHLCFAGHTDVVPAGDDSSWTHPPFAAEVADGALYGRGACDMKSSLAAFAVAARDYLADHADLTGSISLLVTGDEEGPAINGTAKVLEWMAANDHVPDHCVVGEPTSSQRLGDAIKVGRRGSLHVQIQWQGVQGHSAYPHLAVNPVAALARLADRLASTPLDEGSAGFDPSTLALTTFDTGNPAHNVIPERASVRLNIRFNDLHTAQDLRQRITRACEAVRGEFGGSFEISVVEGADSFLTQCPQLIEVVGGAVRKVCGISPILSTSGGTSDARFIKDYCPVVELGPTNATIHQVDERIALDELDRLRQVYALLIDDYFKAFGS